jgi:hypothetical protein
LVSSVRFPANRLTSAQAAGGSNGLYNEEYGYNVTTGNLSSKAGNNYSYGDSAHPHAATLLGSNSYAYVSNGNLTIRTIGNDTYLLGYDAEGRLTTVSGAATAAFAYRWRRQPGEGDDQWANQNLPGRLL